MTPDAAADGSPVAYLDHAASTPVRPEALEAMLPWLGGRCGNPSGAHRLAREARTALDDAREVIADLVGAPPGGVVFTSGGTEADNLAVFGVAGRALPGGVGGGAAGGGRVVCSAVEHHAVLEAVRAVGGRTARVDAAGRVDLDHLAAVLGETPGVALVSVMVANNETGVCQPIGAVAEVVRRHAPGALVHADAVQAACWLDLAEVAAAADLVSLSAHKLGGPKGVGALVVADGVAVAPQLVGGGQERERRSGTQNVPGIVAMAAAVACAARDRAEVAPAVAAMRGRLLSGLCRIEGVAATLAPGIDQLPSIAHVCIEGVETEALIVLLERAGVMVSAAASCASGAMEPSHVLAAMGVPPARAAGSVRFSLGWSSTDADVDAALCAVPSAVARLRAHGR